MANVVTTLMMAITIMSSISEKPPCFSSVSLLGSATSFAGRGVFCLSVWTLAELRTLDPTRQVNGDWTRGSSFRAAFRLFTKGSTEVSFLLGISILFWDPIRL